MTKRKITYVRHPRPIGHKNLCYGQTDLDILHSDELALAQAILSLPLENFQIFSSPLRRCQKVAKSLNKPFSVDPLLKEINFGVYEGVAWDNVPKKQLDLWNADIENFHFPQGESYLDLKKRVGKFLFNTKTLQNTLIIGHAGVIRAILDIFQKTPIQELLKREIPYGHIGEIIF
ncbi:histidine phosphatase family protein [Bacteriovoracales bacterium]|nr:histidine phosphatase family protein [Bacteriovoracales bacterium]